LTLIFDIYIDIPKMCPHTRSGDCRWSLSEVRAQTDTVFCFTVQYCSLTALLLKCTGV